MLLSATAAANSPPWGSWWRGSKPFQAFVPEVFHKIRGLGQGPVGQLGCWSRVVCALPSLPLCHVSEVALALPVMGLSLPSYGFLCPRQ